MTDTAEQTSIYDEAEPPAPSQTADPQACPECGERFDGPGWQLKRGLHRRQAHGIVGMSSKSQRQRRDRGTDQEPSDTGYQEPAGEEKPPKVSRRTGKRQSADELLTMGWAGAGSVLIRTGRDVPVGRVMQFQAAVAGPAIDKLVAGRLVDRIILQRLVRSYGDLEGVAAVLALPFIVGAWERKPEMAPVFEPMARAAIEANLVAMVPVMRKQKAQEAKLRKALDELKMEIPADPDTGEQVDPVTAILASIFAPPPDAE